MNIFFTQFLLFPFRSSSVCCVTSPMFSLNQVLINYLLNGLGGNVSEEYADPYGQGRITIIGG